MNLVQISFLGFFTSGFQTRFLLVLDVQVCKQFHASKLDFILKFCSRELQRWELGVEMIGGSISFGWPSDRRFGPNQFPAIFARGCFETCQNFCVLTLKFDGVFKHPGVL